MAGISTDSDGSRNSNFELFEMAGVDVTEAAAPLRRLVRCLYWSHFLSRWGDRMWEFAVGLLMLQLWPDSLLLVAIYGLVETAAVATLGVLVGELVDTLPRLRTVQLSLGIQNGSVAAAALGIVLLLLFPRVSSEGSGTFLMLVGVVNAFGATSALSGMAMDIVVERDWVVLIAEKQGTGFLTQLNAVMRRIDLICKLLAPVAVGFMMSSVSMLASAVMIAVWNVTSVGVEYWLLHHVYMAMPVLQQKSTEKPAPKSHASSEEELGILNSGNTIQVEDDEEVRLLGGGSRGTQTRSRQSAFVEKLKHMPVVEGWATYMHQEAMLAGLALALLYFTVLSFGSFMTAVLNWRGIPPYVLGLARGVAALCGILATVVYPIVHARLHTVRTGIWSIWIQCSLLSVCVISVWIHNSRVASILLISGVAASRLGLWMFDLSVTQLMQNATKWEIRNATKWERSDVRTKEGRNDEHLSLRVFVQFLKTCGICTNNANFRGVGTGGRERSCGWRAEIVAVPDGHVHLCRRHGHCSPSGLWDHYLHVVCGCGGCCPALLHARLPSSRSPLPLRPPSEVQVGSTAGTKCPHQWDQPRPRLRTGSDQHLDKIIWMKYQFVH